MKRTWSAKGVIYWEERAAQMESSDLCVGPGGHGGGRGGEEVNHIN